MPRVISGQNALFERCYQKLVKFSTSGHFYFENIDLPHPSNLPS
ncbi:hypothetical protein N0824_00256 [Microcystis sp. 0824]|nr:hypothetical protein N0824_00256 [Microcystis sp. 0824]